MKNSPPRHSLIRCFVLFTFILPGLNSSANAIYSFSDSSITDKDGNKYMVRTMPDGNIWTTSNLSVRLPESYCYDNSPQNCEKYGRLYTWQSAQQGCQLLGDGWTLPTVSDWRRLADAFGGNIVDSIEGRKRAYQEMIVGGKSGFNILFGGGEDSTDVFRRIEAHGFYWTASETDIANAWLVNLGKGGKFVNFHNDMQKARAVSVRCIRHISGPAEKNIR